MYPIMTISREFGSGGHAVGLKLSKKLGMPFYDANSIHSIAVESGYIKHDDQLENNTDNVWHNWTATRALMFMSPLDDYYEGESRVIVECAKSSPCIIVGRCADFVLREADIPCLNVLIHADIDYRIARVLELYGNPGESMVKFISKRDKQRKAYYKYYTDKNWGDFDNYDISLDTGSLGRELCADILADLAERFKSENGAFAF